jgi:uncharacterized secreted repeat protein (TIGR03808 family)
MLAGPVLGQDGALALERAILDATTRRQPYRFTTDVTLAAPLRLPDGAHLIANRGTTLRLAGPQARLTAERVARVTLEGLTLDGAGRRGTREEALLALTDVPECRIADCAFTGFGGNGLMLTRSGGRVTGNRFRAIGRGALFSLDATGLSITDNMVAGAGENGLMVWRSAKGHDGTILRGNRIEDVRAEPGGTGPYGNGIAIFRAGAVVAEGNVIRRCRFTAIRNNSGSNVVIAGNTCSDFAETALYVEFAFDGAVIANNIVENAWEGLQVTNFADHGGRMASVTGNVFRRFHAGPHIGDGSRGGGRGVFVEGDVAVAGNVIDGAAGIGLQLGWGPSLRDVTAAGNTIRDTQDGIAISVASGAGHASVTGNTIAGARRHAIVGMEWTKIATGDLGRAGANVPERIRLADNLVR